MILTLLVHGTADTEIKVPLPTPPTPLVGVSGLTGMIMSDGVR